MYTEYLITIYNTVPPQTQPCLSLHLRSFILYSLNLQINFCKRYYLQQNYALKYAFADRIISVWRKGTIRRAYNRDCNRNFQNSAVWAMQPIRLYFL
jgi:hypothetical protein